MLYTKINYFLHCGSLNCVEHKINVWVIQSYMLSPVICWLLRTRKKTEQRSVCIGSHILIAAWNEEHKEVNHFKNIKFKRVTNGRRKYIVAMGIKIDYIYEKNFCLLAHTLCSCVAYTQLEFHSFRFCKGFTFTFLFFFVVFTYSVPNIKTCSENDFILILLWN